LASSQGRYTILLAICRRDLFTSKVLFNANHPGALWRASNLEGRRTNYLPEFRSSSIDHCSQSLSLIEKAYSPQVRIAAE
jgi:hypothetical protein